jgi:putative flippase GtrA
MPYRAKAIPETNRQQRSAIQAVRFLLLGGLNTLATGALFVALASVTGPIFAYTLSFALGIVIAVGATPAFVFGRSASPGSRVRYAGWYLFVYFVGLTFVFLLTDRWGIDATRAAVLTFVLTATLGFAGARLLFGQAR